MYVVKISIDVVIRTMFREKDQCHEKSHRARDIGHFHPSPILRAAAVCHVIFVYRVIPSFIYITLQLNIKYIKIII
jgi:hypothetical protein